MFTRVRPARPAADEFGHARLDQHESPDRRRRRRCPCILSARHSRRPAGRRVGELRRSPDTSERIDDPDVIAGTTPLPAHSEPRGRPRLCRDVGRHRGSVAGDHLHTALRPDGVRLESRHHRLVLGHTRLPAIAAAPTSSPALRSSSWLHPVDQKQETTVEALDPQLRRQAREHLNECRHAADRMRAGVVTLGQRRRRCSVPRVSVDVRGDGRAARRGARRCSPDVVSSLLTRLPRSGVPSSSPSSFSVCLVSPTRSPRTGTSRISSGFPTGGGKTEAYLALVAYSQFLRRLRGRPHGVSALMRYTLRLLTAQQFERAALLMCCCESIRRRRGDLGTHRFEVGLFVGRGIATTVKEARRALDLLAANPTADTSRTGNPMQIRICVWCGTPLGVEDHKILSNPDRCVVECPNPSCEFHDGLPVLRGRRGPLRLSDPTSGHRDRRTSSRACRGGERRGALFNSATRRMPPPDLIIQDELHLISGPLGTLAGLYETAVDLLCTARAASGRRSSPRPPRSVAHDSRPQASSIATMRQFPPPGASTPRTPTSPSKPSPSDKADPTVRRAHGARHQPGDPAGPRLRRAAAGAVELDGAATSVQDPYWTLVGYFNSLRVLGGARMQVQDDVAGPHRAARRHDGVAAATSSSDRADQPRAVRRHPAVPARRWTSRHPDTAALDVVLATNMISVGVDIDRLGLMVVMGQPQATSEYIQATSRVGRTHPGLVVRCSTRRARVTAPTTSRFSRTTRASTARSSRQASRRSPPGAGPGLHAVLVALARMLDRRPSSERRVRRGSRTTSEAVEDFVERVVANGRTTSTLPSGGRPRRARRVPRPHGGDCGRRRRAPVLRDHEDDNERPSW